MRKLKLITILVLFFSAMTFGCSDDAIGPLQGGGEEEEDPIIISPPDDQGNVEYDSLN